MSASTLTLQAALEATYRRRWAYARDGGKCLLSQAKLAVQGLELAVQGLELAAFPYSAATITVEQAHLYVPTATSQWYADGLSPATITKRLNCLSAMGVNVEGHRPPKDRKLKWWLRPEEEERALDLLARLGGPNLALANLIRWTTKTGLRIEETLRLTRADFSPGFRSVTVPGTKTSSSQATLALSRPAAQIASDCFMAGRRSHSDPLITATYEELYVKWVDLCAHLDWPEGATMKALRRSAARYLHVDRGMPLDMVRQYLRHENIATTMEYLRLTGGYGEEEMRRYLG